MENPQQTFADWCSIFVDYIRESSRHDVFRSVSLLPLMERDALLIKADDRYILTMFVSLNWFAYVSWHTANIQLESICSYKYGENQSRHAYWQSWHPNGQLCEKGEFKNGYRTGRWISRYPNGQLWQKGEYRNGIQVGYWQFWRPDGQLKSEGNYKDGLRVG